MSYKLRVPQSTIDAIREDIKLATEKIRDQIDPILMDGCNTSKAFVVEKRPCYYHFKYDRNADYEHAISGRVTPLELCNQIAFNHAKEVMYFDHLEKERAKKDSFLYKIGLVKAKPFIFDKERVEIGRPSEWERWDTIVSKFIVNFNFVDTNLPEFEMIQMVGEIEDNILYSEIQVSEYTCMGFVIRSNVYRIIRRNYDLFKAIIDMKKKVDDLVVYPPDENGDRRVSSDRAHGLKLASQELEDQLRVLTHTFLI